MTISRFDALKQVIKKKCSYNVIFVVIYDPRVPLPTNVIQKHNNVGLIILIFMQTFKNI